MEMSFDGDFEVGIPRDKLFTLLADPQKFVPVLPTFHSMQVKEGDEKTAIVKVKVGIGKVHGLATTEMTLAESEAPVRARYVGKGSVMGSAYTMNVAFDLEDSGTGGSTINWQGSTEIHGKILSIAGGGMRGYAEKEIRNVIGALQSALVSVEHFESVSERAMAPPPPSEGLFAAIIAFFRRLFGGEEKAATGSAEAGEPTVQPGPRRELTPDPVRPIRDIQASIEVDRNGGDRWVGQHLRRKEDIRLVRGHGLFLDDYQSPDMLHMGFVRSPYAHAKILAIDVSAAKALRGVRLVMTGAEVAQQTQPFLQIGAEPGALVEDYGIATDHVRYPGEPLVMIVAESARLVEDAAELVEVEYDPLPAITKSEDALDTDNLLHPQVGSNVIFNGTWDHGDVEGAFREAAHVVKIDRLHFHRFSSTPIETAGAVATWSPRGDIDMISNNGLPGVTAQMIAGYLGVSTEQIRSRSHDVGGNFGTKTVIHTFMGLTALASKNCGGASVKWVESRSDNLASFHGGERTFLDTEVALDADGVITAIRSKHLDDCGGYTRYEPLGCAIWCQVYPATYKLRNLNIEFTQVVSNKAPCTPNRGYSRFQHLWFMERVIDICAHELGIAADEMRLKNYIQPDQFPYTTPNGNVYDSGDYPQMLHKAKALIGYDAWREKQAAGRAEGRLIGIGIGTTLDSGTNNFGQVLLVNPNSVFSGNNEGARIKIGLDGSVIVTLGSVPQGQGHETTTAQTVADELNIGPDMVTVRAGFDSDWNSYGGLSGTIASQFVVTGLSAVHGAAQKLKAQLRRLAAHALQAREEELEFGVGETGPQLSVRGQPERAVNYWMLSNLANCNTAAVPEELRDIDLNVQHIYKPPFELPDVERKYGNQTLTYAAQVHIAVVEVDPQTWQPAILDYAVVDDCGVAINPKIVEGQTHGATCHGIGAALQEAFQFDNEGNLTTATFTDYAPMTSLNMPDLRVDSISTPSPFSFNGAKGCGEGGGAPLHTLSAAVQDALFERDIIITESHNAPSILLEAAAHPNRRSAVAVESR
jgi:2-furoyl-CoA dehydrogenase large subunit